MSSLGNILANSSIYRVLNIAATFILTILLSRLMGTAGYGLFTLIVVNITIYSLISGFGCESGITYHGALGKIKSGKLLSIIFSILFFQIVLLFVINAIHLRVYNQNWFNVARIWPVFFMFLSVSVTDKYNAMFYGHHLYALSNKVVFLLNLVCIGIFATLFFTRSNQDFELYLQTYAVINLLQSLALVVIFHRTRKEPLGLSVPHMEEWKLFFSYSLVTVVTNFIQFLAYRIDYWIIDYMYDDNKLGIYSVAVRLVQMFWILPLLFGGILFPGTAGKLKEFSLQKMLSLLRVMNTLNFIAAIISFFVFAWAIPFFFGKAYTDGILPFQLLLPGIILFCDTTILGAYFAGHNRLKINLVGSTICFFIILLFDILLIPSYGIAGAAMASTIGYGISGLYSTYRFIKLTHVSLSDIFIVRKADIDSLINFFKSSLANK